MSALEIVLAGGTRGILTGFDGRCLVLEADEPLPPGTRVEGTIGPGLTVRGKIVAAARGREAGRFLLTVKLMDLSAADRQRLLFEIGGEPR